ncbi:hypothetical protein Tco_1370784 [Tanacetum coccineum]
MMTRQHYKLLARRFLPKFASLFGFDHRLKAVRRTLSQKIRAEQNLNIGHDGGQATLIKGRNQEMGHDVDENPPLEAEQTVVHEKNVRKGTCFPPVLQSETITEEERLPAQEN